MSLRALAFFQNLFRGPDLLILLAIVLVILFLTRAGRGNNSKDD
jgi:hypothetical protein